MRKWVLLWLVCAFHFSESAQANIKQIKKVQLSERSLLSFHLEPLLPKVGEKVSLFVQAATGVTKNELVIEAMLDAAPLKLTNTGAELWAAIFKPFSEVKAHQVSVNIFVRDALEAGRIRSAMNQLKKEINELNDLINAELDFAKKTALEFQRDQKQTYKDELEVNLDNMKAFLKSESFEFAVSTDANNINFPILSGVSPNTVPLGKRIRILLSGDHLPANPNVKIGGQNTTIISVSSTSIEVLAPNFSITGPKNIEVTFPADGSEPKKNAVLTGSFFVADRSILKNIRPVAVTTGYQKVTWPVAAPINLQADNSYDENGDSFSYEWTVQKAPAGSIYSTGMLLDDSAMPVFTPDKIGIFTIKLRLNETTTEELLSSFVNTVTVEVK